MTRTRALYCLALLPLVVTSLLLWWLSPPDSGSLVHGPGEVAQTDGIPPKPVVDDRKALEVARAAADLGLVDHRVRTDVLSVRLVSEAPVDDVEVTADNRRSRYRVILKRGADVAEFEHIRKPCWVTVRATGPQGEAGEIYAWWDGRSTLECYMETPRIRKIVVRDGSGRPVEGAEVFCRAQGRDRLVGMSGDGGGLEACLVSSDWIWARMSGMGVSRKHMVAGRRNMVIEISTAGEIAGTLRAIGGEPLGGVRVRAIPSFPIEEGLWRTTGETTVAVGSFEARTDAGGGYRMMVDPGRYAVLGHRRGTAGTVGMAGMGSVTVPASGVARCDIWAARTAGLEVSTEAPIREIYVRSAAGPKVKADEVGEGRFGWELPAGRYRVHAWRVGGQRKSLRVDLVPGEMLRETIAFDQRWTVEGVVQAAGDDRSSWKVIASDGHGHAYTHEWMTGETFVYKVGTVGPWTLSVKPSWSADSRPVSRREGVLAGQYVSLDVAEQQQCWASVETVPEVPEARIEMRDESGRLRSMRRLTRGTAEVGPLDQGIYGITVVREGLWGRSKVTLKGRRTIVSVSLQRTCRVALGRALAARAAVVEAWRGGELIRRVRNRGSAHVELEIPTGAYVLRGRASGAEIWEREMVVTGTGQMRVD